MAYCSNCGCSISDDARFCPECGFITPKGMDDTPRPGPSHAPTDIPAKDLPGSKSGFLAVFLSVIIPGLGHLYAGETRKGGNILAFSIICLIAGMMFSLPLAVCPILWIYGILDSPRAVRDYNRGLAASWRRSRDLF